MDTIRVDYSTPARKRDPTASPFAHDTPTTPRITRDQQTPAVDWTGVQFKSLANALKTSINYEHVGRMSSAIERRNRSNG